MSFISKSAVANGLIWKSDAKYLKPYVLFNTDIKQEAMHYIWIANNQLKN